MVITIMILVLALILLGVSDAILLSPKVSTNWKTYVFLSVTSYEQKKYD